MTELTGNTLPSSDMLMPEPPDWVLEKSCTVTVKRGLRFIKPLDPVTHIYIVISGIVTIMAADENGQENMVVSVRAGGVVGEMEALAGIGGMLYSARALEDCRLLRIPLSGFLLWMEKDPIACLAVSRVLAGKLCSASVQSVRNTKLDALQRIVWQFSQYGAGRFELTHQELAELCSVSLRTINRCIKKLKDNGLLSISGGKIELTGRQLEQMKERYL